MLPHRARQLWQTPASGQPDEGSEQGDADRLSAVILATVSWGLPAGTVTWVPGGHGNPTSVGAGEWKEAMPGRSPSTTRAQVSTLVGPPLRPELPEQGSVWGA